MKRITSLLLCLGLLFTFLAFPSAAAAPAEFTTFEAAFKTWRGDWCAGCGPIKMKLEGNAMTLEYRPVFYFDKSFTLTDAEKDSVVADCVEGYKGWEGAYDIGGHTLTIAVDVYPDITDKKLCSSVQILPASDLASMVPGCLIWWPGSPLLTMYLRANNPATYRWYAEDAMHEFGHVLGLFDAYGYRGHFEGISVLGVGLPFLADWADQLLPEAPEDRAPYNCIMQCGWVVTDKEAEMVLYAWSRRRLQLFTKNVLTLLGAEVSSAFCD